MMEEGWMEGGEERERGGGYEEEQMHSETTGFGAAPLMPGPPPQPTRPLTANSHHRRLAPLPPLAPSAGLATTSAAIQPSPHRLHQISMTAPLPAPTPALTAPRVATELGLDDCRPSRQPSHSHRAVPLEADDDERSEVTRVETARVGVGVGALVGGAWGGVPSCRPSRQPSHSHRAVPLEADDDERSEVTRVETARVGVGVGALVGGAWGGVPSWGRDVGSQPPDGTPQVETLAAEQIVSGASGIVYRELKAYMLKRVPPGSLEGASSVARLVEVAQRLALPLAPLVEQRERMRRAVVPTARLR